MVLPKVKNEKYTYADYQTWDTEQRWEIIDGFPYSMSPAPTTKHQEVLSSLFNSFYNYLKGKPCKVFPAPFDVRLSNIGAKDDEVENVVQPDISVICNPMRLDEKGANGAPDLILEILSPSTSKKDMGIKSFLYQRFGVKEYWIVDPDSETVLVYVLDSTGKYDLLNEYKSTDFVKVSIFPDLEINLSEVFQK